MKRNAVSASKYAIGSRHILSTRGGQQSVYEWAGNGWSTPGTGWCTSEAGMAVLGWRYVGPEPKTESKP